MHFYEWCQTKRDVCPRGGGGGGGGVKQAGSGQPGLNQYLARINVLLKDHSTVTPVRL